MIAGGNADGKWSEKRMEGEDGLRTVECLRGRLLAERAASRVAKEDADQMGNKLVELEKQLRVEIKSRNRAEKKMKFLMKKLETLNISYVSEGSEHSSSLEKSDITSVSSTSSSPTKEPEDKQPKTQIKNPKRCEIENTMKKTELEIVSDLKHNVSQTSSSNQTHYSSSIEEAFNSTNKANDLNQNCADSRRDDQSLKSSIEEEKNEENDRDQDDYVDNSLALVTIDSPVASQIIELPIITNASVQEVLDILRHAREKLQSSMERRHMIKVGSR